MMNKKFADKVLTDSQMESVAGGNYVEVSLDASFFMAMGKYPHKWESFELNKENVFSKVRDEVKRLYGTFGIAFACDNLHMKNIYFYGIKRITQGEAIKIVQKKLGKL